MDVFQLIKGLSGKREKTFPPCLIFCPALSGNKESYEPVLAEEAIEQLVGCYLSSAQDEFAVRTFYGDETSLSEIVEECRTFPFFSTRKVVIVRRFEALDKGEKSADAEIQMMLDYLSNPVDTTLLLCVAETVDPKKALYKAFDRLGGVVECPSLTVAQMKERIKQYVACHDKKISSSAMDELIARAGNQLKEVYNSLDLVIGYIGDRDTIQLEDVLFASSDISEETVWNLADAIARGDMANSWLILNELIDQGKDSTEIIGVLHWLLENAYRTLPESEEKPRSTFVERKVAPLATRLGLKKLITAMALCNEATYSIRQAGVDEQLALELLILKLSYVASSASKTR